jgi:hypothetical protein
MELIIYSPTEDNIVNAIEWNFDELKKEITEKANEYKVSVYTEDNIQSAKKDRASLNKFISALEDKRKEVKNQCLKPYEDFEIKIKELVGIIKEAAINIDEQVTGFEEVEKLEKLKKIRKLYDEAIGELHSFLPFECVNQNNYLNKSVTLKKIKEEIEATVVRVNSDLETINSQEKYTFEMVSKYRATLDLNLALQEGVRLKGQEEAKKAFEEEKKKHDEAKKAQIQAQADVVKSTINTVSEDNVKVTTSQPQMQQKPSEEPVYTIIDFRVTATKEQLTILKEFLTTNRIKYCPVPKGDSNGIK